MKNKLIFFYKYTTTALLFLTFLLCCASDTTIFLAPCYSSVETACAAFKNEPPAMLWDIHDVLFKQSKPVSFFERLKTIKRPASFLANTGKVAIDATFWGFLLNKLYYGTKVDQAQFLSALQPYPPTFTEDIIRAATCSYTPCNDTCELVKTLKNAGYKNYLFSNIAPAVLTELIHEFPEQFSSFDSTQNVINAGTTFTYKPQEQAYAQAVQSVHMQGKEHLLVFVDDNLDNIKEAQRYGLNGIWYKTPEQLDHDLMLLMNFR